MIAFNELMENLEKYKKAYDLMELNVNLDSFVALAEKLKKTQLECESKRALCNRHCGELIKMNVAGNDTKKELKAIKELDVEARKLQSKLNTIIKNLNSKLKTLHNLPDSSNVSHLQIETTKTASDLNSLKQELEKHGQTKSSLLTLSEFIKDQSDKILNQDDLPTITYCDNGVVILCTADEIDNLINSLVDYFKKNSLSLIERSIKTLKKSSSREYFIHLKQKVFLKLEVKREFLSRRYKIKYRDKSCDMTKFVNQINLIF